MILQVGDKIICKKECNTLTIGKSYEIISTENIELEICYYILDDNNQSDWFSTNKGSFYIHKYFYTQEELRLLKLESL